MLVSRLCRAGVDFRISKNPIFHYTTYLLASVLIISQPVLNFTSFSLLCFSYLLTYIIFIYNLRKKNYFFDIGDDHQALIWDIQQMPRPIEDPILAYNAAEGEINQIQWGATQPDWIAICYNKCLEILRV